MLAEITAQTLAATRRSLVTTRFRIELSRRLLNQAWGLSGASDVDDPRHAIRDRLERGALSLATRSIRARWGGGDVCVICGKLIATTEIANGSRTDDGQTVWTHLACLRLWREESAAYEVRQIEQERRSRAGLCATVRDRLANGRIPVLPHRRSLLGRGRHRGCVVCRRIIAPGELAYEVVGGVLGRPAYAHPTCYRTWWIESMAHRKSRA